MSILIRTPIEIILISILILVLILIRSGIEAIVRFDEAVFIFMAGMTVIGIFLALPQMDWTNMLPFMRTPPKEFFIGTFQTTYSYAGFELVLLLIPFLKKPDKIFKSGVLAISIVSITYLVATFLSFGYFGVAEVKELIWPTMSVIRSIEVPGSFVERLEGVVMTQWVVFAFTSLIAYTYSLALLPSRVFNTKEFKHFCPLFIPIVYMLAMVPENVVEVYEYLEKSTLYLGTVSIFILPLTILIVSSIRKMGGQNNG